MIKSSSDTVTELPNNGDPQDAFIVGKEMINQLNEEGTPTNPVTNSLNGQNGFFILLGLLCALIFWVFHDFIFLNKVFLYKDIGSDSINGWYPDFYHISDYIRNFGGLPRWSFYAGMGQNISGLIIADPFTWLLYFAHADHIAYLAGYIEALKLITAGVFFYLFLRQLNITAYAAITGALCFACCGFIVLGTCWYQHSAEACQAAFLLFSIEKLLHKKWCYFPFAVALIGVTIPFNLYMFSIIIVVYVFVRLYDQYGWSKVLLTTFGQLFGLGVLGVGMGAFFILPKVQMMLDSPRVSGDAAYFSALLSTPVFQLDGLLDNLTKIGRLFSNDMLGVGSYFTGAENYLEAPLFYAGLLSLLLFPQLFPFLSKKRKWMMGVVCVCALLPFVFPFLRYALWLFAGKYYRLLSFFVALVLIMYATVSLHYITLLRRINYPTLAGTLLFLIFLLYMPNIFGVSNPNQAEMNLFQSNIQWLCLFFLLLYAILIGLLPWKNAVRIIKPVLVGLLLIELAFMANTTVNKRDIVDADEMESKTGYNDYSIDAVNLLHRFDSSFYRIQKTYGSGTAIHGSLKDPMMQRFYGTTSYLQFNQSHYVRFLLAVNLIPPDLEGDHKEWATRWITGLTVDRPLLQIFGNVHYNFSKQPLPPQLLLLNDYITKTGDIHIYKNKFSLPFGYTYSHYMTRRDFDGLADKDIALLNAVIIDSQDMARYVSLFRLRQPVSPDRYTLSHLASDVDRLKEDAFHISRFSQNNIKGNITLARDKLLFFTIPFDKGWKAFDYGKEIQIEMVNIGFSGLLLCAGAHEIELRFEPAGYYPSLIISLFSLLAFILLMLLNRYFANRSNIVT